MHPVTPRAHSAKTRKPRGTKCSARSSSQRCCAEKSQTAPTPDGSEFCRCRQQPSLQTRPLAATLATANTGLLNRSNPERAHPLSAPKPKAQCRSGVRCASGLRQKLAPSIASLHRINQYALGDTATPSNRRHQLTNQITRQAANHPLDLLLGNTPCRYDPIF